MGKTERTHEGWRWSTNIQNYGTRASQECWELKDFVDIPVGGNERVSSQAFPMAVEEDIAVYRVNNVGSTDLN